MAAAAQVAVGDRVQVRIRGQPSAQRGFVRFVGATDFKGGPWVGVQLDGEVGKNDGSVDGTRYFRCRAGHGIFVRPAYVQHVQPLREEEAPTPRVAPRAADGVADALRDLVRDLDRAGVEADGSDESQGARQARQVEAFLEAANWRQPLEAGRHSSLDDRIARLDDRIAHLNGRIARQAEVPAGAARREDAADEWRLRLDGLSPPTNINGGTDDIHGGCTCLMASWLVQLLGHGQTRLAALQLVEIDEPLPLIPTLTAGSAAACRN